MKIKTTYYQALTLIGLGISSARVYAEKAYVLAMQAMPRQPFKQLKKFAELVRAKK